MTSDLAAGPRRARALARRVLARTPRLWDGVCGVRPVHRERIARADSALVIDGFPRSGNSYSRAAFEIANGTGPHLGHHQHAPAHILRAVRLGRPTIVLVRAPRDAVLSYLVYDAVACAADVLREYISFYRSTLPVLDDVVVAGFERVTQDFGEVLVQVNRTFGTTLTPYVRTEENEAAVAARVEHFARLRTGGDLPEHQVARPSQDRAVAKANRSGELDRPRAALLLARAEELYRAHVMAEAEQRVLAGLSGAAR